MTMGYSSNNCSNLLWVIFGVTLVQGITDGAVHTTSGYDHLHGTDAICWSAPNWQYHDWYQPTTSCQPQQLQDQQPAVAVIDEDNQDHEHEFEGKVWKNDLIPEFPAGETVMESDCPTGTRLTLDIAHEPTHGSDKLRTQRFYTYHFVLDIDLTAIRQAYGLSDHAFFYSDKAREGTTGLTHPQISVRVQFCPLNGNLCTPFILEAELGVETIEAEIHQEGDDHSAGREHDHGNVVVTSDVWAEEHDHGHTEAGDHTNEGSGEHEHDHRRQRRRATQQQQTQKQQQQQQRYLLRQPSRVNGTPTQQSTAAQRSSSNVETRPSIQGRRYHRRLQAAEGLPTTSVVEVNGTVATTSTINATQSSSNATVVPSQNVTDAPSNGTAVETEHEEADNGVENEEEDGDQAHDEQTGYGPEEVHDDHAGEEEHAHKDQDDHDHEGDDHHGQGEEGDENGHLDHDWHAATSPYFYLEIPISNQSVFRMEYDIDIELIEAGDYLPLAAVEFFMTNETIHGHAPGEHHENGTDDGHANEFAVLKFDIANLMVQRSVIYYDPIVINEVSDSMAIISYILIALCGSIQLFLLACTIWYKKENVMKLSQGFPFLMLLSLAGLIAMVSSVFFSPANSVFCSLSSPLTYIPMQFMLAVVFGRLRRIITIMGPLMGITDVNDKKAMKQRFQLWRHIMMPKYMSSEGKSSKYSSKLSSQNSEGQQVPSQQPHRRSSGMSVPARSWWKLPSSYSQRTSALRQQYTAHQLWFTIFFMTLPMIVVEVIRAAVFSQNRHLVLNDDESQGRYECGNKDEHLFQFASVCVLILTVFINLHHVQKSKKLPALFNEAESVSTALLFSLFIAAFGVGIVILNDTPTGNPSFSYIAKVVVVLVFCLQLTARLLLPKLKLIWKGEKVVVARLLQEHKQKEQKNETVQQFGKSYVTGLEDPTSRAHDHLMDGSNTTYATATVVRAKPCLPSEMLSQEEKSDVEQPDGSYADNDADVERPDGSFAGDDDDDEANVEQCKEDAVELKTTEPETQKARRRKKLVVEPGQAPPTKLAMNVLSMSNEIMQVNERVMTGLQVNKAEWQRMIESLDEFRALLENVEFKE